MLGAASTFFERAHKLLLAVAVLLTFALLAHMLSYTHAGLDISDEGYYLNAISRPWEQGPAIRLFGFFYHPFYLLLGEDVGLLRAFNMLSLYTAAVYMFMGLFQRPCPKQPDRKQELYHLALSLVLGASAFYYFHWWLPSPSYNSLALLGHLLCMASLLRLCKVQAQGDYLNWGLLGFSVWMIFLSKPPSLLSVTFLVSAYLLLNKKWEFKGVGFAALFATMLFVGTAIIASGYLTTFISNYLIAIELEKFCWYNGIPILRLDPWLSQLSIEQKLFYGFRISAIVLLFDRFCAPSDKLPARLLCLLVALASLFGFFPLLKADATPPWPLAQFHVEHLLFLPFAAFLLLATKLRGRSLSLLANVVIFSLFAFSCAMGTNNNYNHQATWFGIFFIVPLVYAAIHTSLLEQRSIEVIAIILLLLASATTIKAMNHPYRLSGPLSSQTEPIQPLGSQSVLKVGESLYRYVSNMQTQAMSSGYTSGTQMIDFTGRTPGAAYLLGAKPVARAWLSCELGGTPCIARYLRLAPCTDIASAWVLFPALGRECIDPSLLAEHGVDWQKDLQLVGSLQTPQNAPQSLYKPIRPYNEALAACEAARASRRSATKQ